MKGNNKMCAGSRTMAVWGLVLTLVASVAFASCGGKDPAKITAELESIQKQAVEAAESGDAEKAAKLAEQVVKLTAELEKAKSASAGKASKASGKAAPASDFTYDATKDGKGVIIKKYTGAGGKVVIPAEIEGLPVVEIGENSFKGVIGGPGDNPGDKLTAVVIPASVKMVWSRAFSQCAKLTSVTFLGSGVTLENDVFRGCTELAELVFPDDENAFIIYKSEGVDWGTSAFLGCKKLPLAVRAKLKAMGFYEP